MPVKARPGIKEQFDLLAKPYTVLLVIDPGRYQDGLNELIRYLFEDQKMSGMYLTAAKSAVKLDELFRVSGINTDNLFFIDTVSKMTSSYAADSDRVRYVENPNSLTEISIALSKFLKIPVANRMLIVDSISALLVHNDAEGVSKFIHFLHSKVSGTNTSAIFIALKGETDKTVQTRMSQFVDKIIEI